mmetsp:Transcript_12976/g.40950  ORF Transcript_12976/g.40950 Transcript_12976/m.40950 type:complete len:82 (-) Transcript_12976:527-772(-)
MTDTEEPIIYVAAEDEEGFSKWILGFWSAGAVLAVLLWLAEESLGLPYWYLVFAPYVPLSIGLAIKKIMFESKQMEKTKKA